MARLVLLFLLMTAQSAWADIIVRFADGNPHDRFWIKNIGCHPLAGIIHIDLAPTAGQVIVDTRYGGPGTKDPMPVEVEQGDIALAPVADGATDLTIYVHALPPDGTAIVTLDLDDTRSFWFSPRVEVDGWEVEHGTVTFTVPKGSATATFDVNGMASVSLSANMNCAPPAPASPPQDVGPLIS